MARLSWRTRGAARTCAGARRLAAAALLLIALAAAVAASGLVRHNNWYLASDQFAFLTFAADLRRGTVFHDDEVFEEIAPERSPAKRYDALSQTYFWRDGALYSRYPPGFPAILAVAGLLGGEAAEHAVNPVLYLAVLLLAARLVHVLVAPRDRSLADGAAAVTAWLVLLLATGLHLWGITVVRDLPAHLLALAALLAAVRGRTTLAGLALGAACVVRVDAVLYAVALGAVARARGLGLRAAALAAAAFAVGATPLLLYNVATEGAPLSFTEGGELRDFFASIGEARGIAAAQSFAAPSGGGFRLAHLAETLPDNAARLFGAFAWLAPFGALGTVWSLRERRLLAAAFLPYPAAALLFYSLWVHADFRYLAGASLCLIPLVAVGIVLAYRRVASAGAAGRAGAIGAAAAAGVAAAAAGPGWAPGAAAVSVYAGAAVAAALPRRRLLRRAAPLLAACALAAPATLRAARSEARAPFQRDQVAAARAAVASVVPPGSLVMVAPGLGRPVENLRVYSQLDAFYTGEMALLDRPVDVAAIVFVATGRRAFYLLPAGDRETAARLRPLGRLRKVGERRGAALLEWFVDPRRAPGGAALWELEVDDAMRERLRRYLGRAPAADGGAPAAPRAPS